MTRREFTEKADEYETHIVDANKKVCTWTEKEDEKGIYYDTGCGRSYCVEYTQSPIANMELCPYCGKKLVEAV